MYNQEFGNGNYQNYKLVFIVDYHHHHHRVTISCHPGAVQEHSVFVCPCKFLPSLPGTTVFHLPLVLALLDWFTVSLACLLVFCLALQFFFKPFICYSLWVHQMYMMIWVVMFLNAHSVAASPLYSDGSLHSRSYLFLFCGDRPQVSRAFAVIGYKHAWYKVFLWFLIAFDCPIGDLI